MLKKKIKACLEKRKLENQSDGNVLKKIKLEKFDNVDNSDNEEDIKRKNADIIKIYNSIQRRFNKNTHNDAIIKLDMNENAISTYSLGEMNLTCPFCKAVHFCFEQTREKLFSTCCCKGKIKLNIDEHQYPECVKQLTKDKSFLRLSRIYNNLLALGSFTAKIQTLKGKGPQTVRVCGQVYHNVESLHPDNEDNRQHGQLYILDNEAATKNRIENNTGNEKLSEEIMSILDKLLRDINPYVKSYKMMYEVEQEQIKNCGNNSTAKNEVRMILIRNPCLDKNRYNIAACNEVAVVFVGENGDPPLKRDICIYEKTSNKPLCIPNISKHVDPMVYPLMFPFGESGWSPYMKSLNLDHSSNISALQYYKYVLSARKCFSRFLNLGRITQQFVVDQWVKIESTRLYFIRKNQHTLRTELYKGSMDYLQNKSIKENAKIGRMIILPSSFEGSARNMKQNFIDSTVLIQEFGKPTYFLTMTCNGEWDEILENIEPHENASDRPDIVVKVFEGKLKALIRDLTENHILGRCIAYTYVIEFQKRGLPHAHILIWIHNDDKIRNGDDVDKHVSAEIPDENVFPKLYGIVKKFMIHGPCGDQNPKSPCMENNICTKKFLNFFLKQFSIILVILIRKDVIMVKKLSTRIFFTIEI